MIFAFFVFLSVLIIITLLVLFFVRTYDTIKKVQENNDQKLNLQKDTDKQLENKFDNLIKKNDQSIVKNKAEIIKKLNDMKKELDLVDSEVADKIIAIKEEEDKMSDEIENVADQNNESIKYLTKKTKESLRHLDGKTRDHLRMLEAGAEIKREELHNTLNELKDIMENELRILKEDVRQTDSNVEQVRSETLEPIQKSVSSLEDQIKENKIKVSDYILNYDRVTRNLNLDYNDSEDPDHENSISSHVFTHDGTARHIKGIETPVIDFGRYEITEEDDELVLRDSETDLIYQLSKTDKSV